MSVSVAQSTVGVVLPATIGLEDGWRQIDAHGLQKLFRIIQSGRLHEANGNGAVSASALAAKQPEMGFTNEEYAQLYT